MASIFADAYSRYLTNACNYKHRFNMFRGIFRNGYIYIKSSQMLNKELIDSLDEFPKFPYFFNVINKDDSMNLVNIYNSSLDNTGTLLDTMIDVSILSKKSDYDLIPNDISNLTQEAYFQYAYLSTPSDIYNTETYLKSFTIENNYRNFYSDLYASLFYKNSQTEGQTAGLENNSAIIEYSLFSLLITLLEKSHDLYSKLLNYIIYTNTYGPTSERITRQVAVDDFNAFLTQSSWKMSYFLSDLITRSIYNFDSISYNLRNQIISVINSKILDPVNGLGAKFDTFTLSMGSLDPMFLMVSNSINNLNGIMTADCVCNIYNDSAIINQSYALDRLDYEEEEYNIFINKISENSMQNYLFLCFMYKFWPGKFLNILQLTTKEYTENIIKTPSDDFEEVNKYMNELSTFAQSYINYPNLRTFLNSYITLTPTNYLYSLSEKFKTVKFGCCEYYLLLIEEFVNSDGFNDFVTDLLESVFIYLRDNGHVDSNYDWYSYKDIVKIYLKTAMRWKIFDKSTMYITSDFKEASFKFTNGNSIVKCKDINSYNAVTVGDYIFMEKDSEDYAVQVISKHTTSEYILVLSSNYPGTTSINWNTGYYYTTAFKCLFEDLTTRFKTLYDRTITNSTGMPAYNISVTIPDSDSINATFNSLASSSTISRSMHQFVENLTLSTLTREIIYATLGNFVV